ncbi:MAG: hypothetical protein SFV21_06535 [Rhodospirillaceae bacterium]|nr:hypothetical protein [Rhodospirillaceae bacterium]
MIDIGTITLYREKSTVHRFGPGGGGGEGGTPELVISSNRVTLPLKSRVDNFNVAVRGQNVTGAMRMTAVVIDELRRDENLLYDPGQLDWDSFWRRRLSSYEAEYNRDAWVSLHVNGTLIYTSKEGGDPALELERVAAGREVTEAMVLEAVGRMLGQTQDLVVEHDSQTAFVFTPFPTYHRAAILERQGRRTGSYAISVYHPAPAKPVRLSHFINFCADLTEALTMKGFMERVQELVATDRIAKSGITPTQITAARNRRRELQEAIENFERTNKVVYRPDRPSFF